MVDFALLKYLMHAIGAEPHEDLPHKLWTNYTKTTSTHHLS